MSKLRGIYFRCVRVARWCVLGASAAIVVVQPAAGAATSPHAGIVPFLFAFSSPVDIVSPPDGSGRLFVVQQGGAIRIIEGGQIVSTPFLTLTGSTIQGGGERGLLSMVFHPDYATNGFFYLCYTRAGDAALTIARYSRSAADPRLANAASGQVLLTIPHSTYDNHNGGKLLFGPDGYLYSSHGDGGSGDDPLNSGQNLGTLLGKLLRIDVDGGFPYTIPADNPFLGVINAMPEIFAYGLRNVWRMSFDRTTGDLYLGDVGQGAREEIDLIPAASLGGENFGWRVWEGTRCNTSVATTGQCAALVQTPPILEYDHSSSGAGPGVCGPAGGSVTGGFRYRGSAIPAMYGRYVFADYCSGRMWTAWPAGMGVWQKAIFADTGLQITTFGEDGYGEIYFAASGTIYRIVADETAGYTPPDVSGDAKADLVWRNAVSGATAVWLMNGLAPLSFATLFADPNWIVTHTGDFNGDGKKDLVWRNTVSGQTAIWLMNGTALLASAVILTDATWLVTHTGDFNGDGRADLVWRNATTGQTAIWLMNGTSATSSAVIYSDPAWLVTHVADFNGDTGGDLVWRNAGSGQNAIWLMNGTATVATSVLGATRNWAVSHTGDFNGDGRADLIWRNVVTGQTAAWLMNGTVPLSTAVLISDPSWSVVQAADLSGDARSDLIWRHRATGQTAVWVMNGIATTASAIVYADPLWKVTHAGDLDGDGRADLIWRKASGESAAWLMNGVTVLMTGILSSDSDWSVMGLNADP